MIIAVSAVVSGCASSRPAVPEIMANLPPTAKILVVTTKANPQCPVNERVVCEEDNTIAVIMDIASYNLERKRQA
jgi:hypothetical protein